MSSPAVTHDIIQFDVDREHGGLRLIVLLTFLTIWIAVFFALNALLSAEGPALLAVLAGFAVAYFATIALERWLKRTWRSGRVLRIGSDGIELRLRDQRQAVILSEDPVSILFWNFVISRRARIPKGWSMFACALTAEEQVLTFYTFMSPQQVEAFARRDTFTRLQPKKARTLNDDEREDLRLAGAQRRLRDAENLRWMSGAEMTAEDFVQAIDLLHARFAEWVDSPR